MHNIRSSNGAVRSHLTVRMRSTSVILECNVIDFDHIADPAFEASILSPGVIDVYRLYNVYTPRGQRGL